MLEPVVMGNLITGHSLMRICGEQQGGGEFVSLHRQSIEGHAVDRHPNLMDALIDAARDILTYLIASKPIQAHGFIEKCLNSDSQASQKGVMEG